MFPLKDRKVGGYAFGQKTWYSRRHLGTDYSAEKGTTLYAPFDGEIIRQFYGVEGGNTIWFKPSGQNVVIRFMHLSNFFGLAGPVKWGEAIGHTGNTGALTRGAHLHLDISKGAVNIWNFNNFIDPDKFDWDATTTPIPSSNEKGLFGIDVSHYQKINWADVKADFAILKCTESTTFKDPTYETNKAGARKKGILVGNYHFARGTDAVREAQWFVKNVGDIQQGEFLVLDWEISHPATVSWCLTFLKKVEELVGFKPLIYLNQATVNSRDWSLVINNDNGLWIARYYTNSGKIEGVPASRKWPFWVIHQYTSRGNVAGITGYVDLDHCKCDLPTLRQYGKQ